MQKIEAVHFEEFFVQRLKRYDVEKAEVVEEAKAQMELIPHVREAYDEFVHSRRVDASTKKREEALQSMENAYHKYKEIIVNLDVGRKFYNDLSKIVVRFRDECRAFAHQRRMEAADGERSVIFDCLLA